MGKGYSAKSNQYNLNFLQLLPFLKGITILDQRLNDITAINQLHELRYAIIDTCCGSEVDFSNFPAIEEASVNWHAKIQSLFEASSLKRLVISDYTGKSSYPFGLLRALKSLSIYGGNLSELTGFKLLHHLNLLGLIGLKKLTSLMGIESLSKLTKLSIDDCKNINSINEISQLNQLKWLNISNNKDIESLLPVRNLMKLEVLHFYEQTNIVDGDIAPLKKLLNLQDVRYQNRRHYNLRKEEFPPWN